jgi:hypothetical protein
MTPDAPTLAAAGLLAWVALAGLIYAHLTGTAPRPLRALARAARTAAVAVRLALLALAVWVLAALSPTLAVAALTVLAAGAIHRTTRPIRTGRSA